MPKRVFLSPDDTPARLAARWIAGRYADSLGQTPPSLEGVEILLPTKGAARAVRAELALELAQRGVRGFAGGAVRTFEALFAERLGGAPLPNDAETFCLWAKAVKNADCPELFCARKPEGEELFAFVEKLRRLSDTVAENLLSFRDMCARLGAGEDAFRWRDLARLEGGFLRGARALGLAPKFEALRDAVKAPLSARRFAAIGFYELTGAQIRLLENAEKSGAEVEVVVFADEKDADSFDAWGVPNPEAARARDVGLDDEAIRVVETAADEARLVGELARAYGSGRAADMLAVSCDQRAAERFARAFARASGGIPAAVPESERLSKTVVRALLGEMAEAARSGRFFAVRAFLRNPYVLEFLRRKDGVAQRDTLAAIDGISEKYPASLDAALDLALADGATSAAARVFSRAKSLLPCGAAEAAASVRALCAHGIESPDAAREDAARAAACEIFERLESACARTGARFDGAQALEFVRRTLARMPAPPRPAPENAVLLRDWMEIFWARQPHVVLCDMNEGIIPEKEARDDFLNDDMRARLGLRTRAQRTARDIWMLETRARVSRKIGGACEALASRVEDGDPLAPSRLLLRVRAESLPSRVRAVFEPPAARASPEFNRAWEIAAPKPQDESLRRISVSALGDYLASPWSFYLKYVLRGASYDGDGIELDSAQFGTILHEVWRRFAESSVRGSENEKEIAAALLDGLSDERKKLGSRLRAQIRLQLMGLDARLRKMAEVQAARRRAGWEILESERSVEIPFDVEGERFLVTGRIDRIDFRPSSESYCVVDYKTKNADISSVESAHFKKKGGERQWLNLQMPLYAHWARETYRTDKIGAAYFVSTNALENTDFKDWNGIGGVLEEACEKTRWILRQIQMKNFSPEKSPKYGGFEEVCGLSETELKQRGIVKFL